MDKPAFPIFPETATGHEAAFRGLTRRELFAAMGAQGIAANPSFFGPLFQQDPQAAAEFGAQFADALCAELDKADD